PPDVRGGACGESASETAARAQQAYPEPFERELVVPGVEQDRLEFGVLGQQLDLGSLPAPALDGDVVADPGDDDLAVADFLGSLDGEQVAVEDAGVAHAHAPDPKQVVGGLGEQRRVDGVAGFDVFLGEDRAAGGDPAHQG